MQMPTHLKCDFTTSGVAGKVFLDIVCNLDILVEWRKAHGYVESSFPIRSPLMVCVNGVIT